MTAIQPPDFSISIEQQRNCGVVPTEESICRLSRVIVSRYRHDTNRCSCEIIEPVGERQEIVGRLVRAVKEST